MAEKEIPVEEVVKLYQMGLNDSKVIRRLTEEGFSPVQISDALNQAKIKQEIELSDLKSLPSMPLSKMPKMQMPAYQETQKNQAAAAQDIPVPRPSAIPPVPAHQSKNQRQPAAAAQPRQVAQQEEETAYPYAYPTYQEEPTAAAPKIETEVIEEIVEQIVDEKWQEVKAKIGDVIEWKNYADRRINSTDERIKRLETIAGYRYQNA